MKNVFGYPYGKTEDMPCDGARFITNRADAALKKEIDDVFGKALETGSKASLPGWLQTLKLICYVGAAIVAISLLRNLGDLTLAEMYGNAPAIFYGGGVCLALWAVLFCIEKLKYKKVDDSGEIDKALESMEELNFRSEEQLGGLGFSFKWDMGYMHDTLDYFATDPLFRSGKHDKLTFSMMYAFSENFILAYSHDEVVHGKKSMLDKMFGSYEQKFATLRSLYGYQFAHPGKKLCFMGSEFGQFIEWNYEQSLDWLLLDYPMHEKLQEYYRSLNKLYTSYPALYDCDKSWDGFKWLNVNDKDRSSIAFLRSARPENDSYLICACNFIPNEHRGFVIGLPESGVLREVLSSDDVRFGGSGLHNEKPVKSRSKPFCDLPYSAQIDLPPLSTVYFEYIPERMSDKNEEGV